VLPVIAATFGRISLVSLPANLLAAPVFVLALFASAATALAGVLDPGLGRLAGEVGYLPLNALVRVGRAAADVPGASLEVSGIGAIEIFVMCVAVAAIILLVQRLPAVIDAEPEPRGRVKPALAAAALVLVAAAFVWWGDLRPESSRLSFTVLDVGQGDALLIETPAGARILVDGGPSGARLVQALGRRLPPSERRIDLIVLTHAQDDHVTGFVELLQRFQVGGALAGALEGETAAYEAWREELAQQDVPLLVAAAGQSIDLGDGVRLEVLGPPPDALIDTEDDYNNNSVVLRLVYGSVSFLLTGDLAAEGEDALLASGADLHSTVLKVGHHGSDGSTTPAFLDAVGPELAVISAGAGNNFGHPSPTTRLRLAGVPLLRTDLNGDVRFETDGSALWVAFDRGDYARVQLGAAR
jgi:competence protein ComEC